MAKYLKMVLVLVCISSASGFILGPYEKFTAPKAEMNVLKRKKIPAVINIIKDDPKKLSEQEKAALETEILAGKRDLAIAGKDKPALVFIISKDGQAAVAVVEGSGKGYGGDVNVMVGFDLATGDLAGVGVGDMKETPGVGTRVKDEPWFTAQFRGMKKGSVFKVKKDGGVIDAVSGATRSSRAVATGVGQAKEFYDQHADEIKKLAATGSGETK